MAKTPATLADEAETRADNNDPAIDDPVAGRPANFDLGAQSFPDPNRARQEAA